MIGWRVLAPLLSLVAGLVLGSPSMRSEPPNKGPERFAAPALKRPPAIAVPNPYKLSILIRTTIIALNQANLTGNYSVVRDLAAPSFREVNSSARLAEIFSGLRRRHLDLSPILLLEPKLVRPPALMDNGSLRLSGFFPSAPEQVNFDLAFQRVGGQWRLFAISLGTRRVAVPASTAGPAAQPQVQINRPQPAMEEDVKPEAKAKTTTAAKASSSPMRSEGAKPDLAPHAADRSSPPQPTKTEAEKQL